MYEGADRVRGRWEMRGREGVGEGSGGRKRGGVRREGRRGRNIGEKGKEGKKELLRDLRGEDRDKGWEWGGVEAYPLSTPSCMLKCVPCVCLFIRMLTLFNVVQCNIQNSYSTLRQSP